MSWNLTFGKVQILAAEDLDWSFGKNTALRGIGQGETYVQQLGDAPNVVTINAVIDKSLSGSFRDELQRTEPVLLIGDSTNTPLTDIYSAGSIYVTQFGPLHHVPHLITDSNQLIGYRGLRFSLYVWGDTDNYARATRGNAQWMPNTFDLDGTFVVPLPIGASGVSETVAGTRVTNYGTILVVKQPTLENITYSVSETNLGTANVYVYKSGKETVVDTGMLLIRSRNDEATNKGMFDLSVYTGGSMLQVGTFDYAFKSGGGSIEYFSAPPEIEVLHRRRNKERETLVITYPSSVSNAYKSRVHLTVWRGKPFFQSTITNCGNTMSEARMRVNLAGTTYVYFTGAGTTLHAGSDTYGGTTIAGDTDSYNYSYLHDVNPAGTAAYEVGFIRFKKTDADHMPNDNGAYWDSITLKYDNLNAVKGDPFPHFVTFAQYQNTTGESPAQLGQEAVMEPNLRQIVVRKT